MSTNFEQVAPQVQEHVKRLVKTAGLPETEESLELLAGGWLEKQSLFTTETAKKKMEEVETFAMDEAKGALVLTYSGSLITIGPDSPEGRSAEYASIGLRSDVPETGTSQGARLLRDITVGGIVEFKNGPIQKSSPVLTIAVVSKDMDAAAETRLLDEVTMVLTKDFVDVNKTMIAN